MRSTDAIPPQPQGTRGLGPKWRALIRAWGKRARYMPERPEHCPAGRGVGQRRARRDPWVSGPHSRFGTGNLGQAWECASRKFFSGWGAEKGGCRRAGPATGLWEILKLGRRDHRIAVGVASRPSPEALGLAVRVKVKSREGGLPGS